VLAALVRNQVPLPFLTTLIPAPEMSGAKELGPMFVPVSVTGCAARRLSAPGLVNDTVAPATLPEATMVRPPFMVNRRSVLCAVAPVYCSVAPAPKTRLAAALDEAPMLLGRPPLARAATLTVPPLMVVAPV